MEDKENLLRKRKELKKKLVGMLNSVMQGHIRKSPAMTRASMTLKVNGKTVTRSLKKKILNKAEKMTKNHLLVRELLKEISEVNWELLKIEGESK